MNDKTKWVTIPSGNDYPTEEMHKIILEQIISATALPPECLLPTMPNSYRTIRQIIRQMMRVLH